MKKILVVLIVVLFFSCKKETVGTIYNNNVFLLYLNDNGKNILNADGLGTILTDDIDVYIIKKGLKVRVFDEFRDYKESFTVSPSPSGNVLNFFFEYSNDTVVDDTVVMFIRYKDNTEDKLVGEFNSRSESNNMIIKKVWVNDILKWERVPSGSTGIIELIK